MMPIDASPRRTGTEQSESGLTAAMVATGLLALAAAGAYLWLVFKRWDKLGSFGAAGDAIGPFTGLATVGALIAALWSVKLQREELRLQREEMAESRKELARAAEAQEELAKAQRDNTEALRAANTAALRAQAAQHAATAAQLSATIAQLGLAPVTDPMLASHVANHHADELMKRLREEDRRAKQAWAAAKLVIVDDEPENTDAT